MIRARHIKSLTMAPRVATVLLLLGGALGASPQAQADPTDDLAERLLSAGLTTENVESQVAGLCPGPPSVGDLTEGLLRAGIDVFTVVRDVILACGTGGKGPEVAAEVASRAHLIKGDSARHLIDAGVLAAAAEIEQRRQNPTLAAANEAPQPDVQRTLDRERLARMMQKGLIDDEYREYIEERRKQAEQVAPAYVPSVYSDLDSAIYGLLLTLGLVSGGYLDDELDVGADPGGSASSR